MPRGYRGYGTSGKDVSRRHRLQVDPIYRNRPPLPILLQDTTLPKMPQSAGLLSLFAQSTLRPPAIRFNMAGLPAASSRGSLTAYELELAAESAGESGGQTAPAFLPITGNSGLYCFVSSGCCASL